MTYEEQKNKFEKSWEVKIYEGMTYDNYNYITAGIPTIYTPIAYFKDKIVYKIIYKYYSTTFVNEFKELANKYNERFEKVKEFSNIK